MNSIRRIAKIACFLSAIAIMTSSVITYVNPDTWRYVAIFCLTGTAVWGSVWSWAAYRLTRKPAAEPPQWLKYAIVTIGAFYSFVMAIAFIG